MIETDRREMFKAIAIMGLGAVATKIPDFVTTKVTEWVKVPNFYDGMDLRAKEFVELCESIAQLQLEVQNLKDAT